MESRLNRGETSQQSQRQYMGDVGTEVTSCLTQLYAPSPPHAVEMDIVFFHGLQLDFKSDSHLSTWRTGDDSGELWPKSWLPSEYPRARILIASYDACIQTTATTGRQDLYSISETLFYDLCIIREEQGRNCPLILVGHSFGGLVIKQLCVIAHAEKDVNPFIQRVRGIFFYATPHRGMSEEFLSEQGMGSISANEPLLIFVKELSTNAARLHKHFINVQKKYEWKIFGLGETCVPEGACSSLIVKEASSRFGDEFFLVQCDHFSICRPKDRECSSYLQLVKLIKTACGRKLKGKKGKRASSRIVGIDSLVLALTERVEQHTFLGLGGMGGVGKTTVAELLFEELQEEFEYTCFVEELKLITGSKDDVKEKIWKKMRRDGQPIAKTCTWDDLRGGKLLMVLDDIDKHKHVDLIWDIVRGNAVQDSRYIVTSRDMGLLGRLGEYGKTHICEIPLLKDEEAERLFYSYAFPNGEKPVETLEVIVEEIVRICSGLPLTLKVLGTHLRAERDERIWAEIPSAVKTAQSVSSLEERIWAILRVSYDVLEDDEKDLFLEVACTFSRDDLGFQCDEMEWALASKYESLNNLLKTLVDKCLIKVVEEEYWWRPDDYGRWWRPGTVRYRRLQMHEHLRSMGCKTARDLGRSTDHLSCKLAEEDQSVLHDSISRQKIASLCVVPCEHVTQSCLCQLALLQSIQAALPDMTGLRYLNLAFNVPKIKLILYFSVPENLILYGENVDGHIRESFPYGVLSLPESAVMVRFDGYSWGLNFHSVACFKELVVLNLTIVDGWPPDLLSAAVCERLPALKCLLVRCFSRRKTLEIALEKLGKLQHFWLQYSGKLPGSLRHLPPSLESLDLGSVSLPDTVGNWSRLEQLYIRDCFEILELPGWFGNLSRMRHLELDCLFDLVALPETFGKLSNLKHLEMNWCLPLQKLPDTFGNLSNLEHLAIICCEELQELPDTFGNLTRLRYLKIECVLRLRELPATFGNLTRLQYLKIKRVPLRELPASFGNFSNLEHLEICWCDELRKLPDTFGNLTRLQYLKIADVPLRELPASSGNLSRLQRLEIERLERLQYMPDSFRNLSSLEHLSIWRCDSLEDFSAMLGNMDKLKYLQLVGCPQLRVLSIQFGSLTSLERVELSSCWSQHEEELRKKLNFVKYIFQAFL